MRKNSGSSRWLLVLVAIAIGLVIACGADLLLGLAAGRSPAFVRDGALTRIGIASFPFLVLAVSGVRALLPWLVGLAMTLALWSWYVIDGISSLLGEGPADANIGLGILMLASPLFITAFCLIAHWLQGRADRRR